MKKYMMIMPETLGKMGKCFSSPEEVQTFISHMDEAMDEIQFMSKMRWRVAENESTFVLLRQVCVFALFCREYMELVHELVRNIEGKEISEDEMKDMLGK